MRFHSDLRLAARTLTRSSGFTIVAVLTLGLGIGASTAVFTVFDSLLLTPLGYAAPDRLVRVELFRPEHPDASMRQREYLSVPFVYALRSRDDVFAALAGMNSYRELGADLTTGSDPRRVRELPVAVDFFATLGVRPQLGRWIGAEEPDLNVAVVSHELWRGALGGDPDIIGGSIRLDDVPHVVVGVMPAGFPHPLGHEADVWTPEDVGPTPASRQDWGNGYLEIIGRLAPGVTIARAQQQLDAYSRALSERIDVTADLGVRLSPLQDATVGEARATLWVLLGAVALLLLSACVNVTNLFLARGIGRARELAMRVALGAGRWGLLRHLLSESLLLAAVGGAAGLAVAYACVRVLAALQPEGLPRTGEIALDGSVLAFSAAIVVGAGLVFGILPGARFLRAMPSRVLREGGARAGRSGVQRRLQHGLVVSQVAAALLLLVGAGVLVKSFLHLQRVDPGFEPKRVFTFTVSLPDARYSSIDSRIAFHHDLHRRIDALPEVSAAGAVDWMPVQGRYHPWGFRRLDVADPERERADARVVHGDYFRATGIPLIRGRLFSGVDRVDGPKVAVVSRSVAERTFREEEVLGKRIRLLGREWEIVGVVGDVTVDPFGTVVPLVYLPHDQFADNRNWLLSWVVSWTGDLDRAPARIRDVVAAVDPNLVVYDAKPLRAVVAGALARERFTLLLMGTFAGAALLLAGIGLYGVLSYVVREQTREIGVRVALGARRADVMALVLGRAFRMVLAGVAVGALVVLPLMRWLRSLAFEVHVMDPWVLASVVAVFLGVAAAAAYGPTRRALGLDPAEVMRDA